MDCRALQKAIVAHQKATQASVKEEEESFASPLDDYSLYGACIEVSTACACLAGSLSVPQISVRAVQA